jgi:hypothetical protein
MSAFDEYASKYKTARMERRNGVLQVTLHTDGGSLRWRRVACDTRAVAKPTPRPGVAEGR